MTDGNDPQGEASTPEPRRSGAVAFTLGARRASYRAALLALVLLVSITARAQDAQTGHYIPGWNGGLTAGMMAVDPGVYMANTTHFYHAGIVRDGSGDRVPGAGSTNSIITELALVLRPDFKLFGGDYQIVVAPSVGNLSGRPVPVDGELQEPPVGLSDTFFSPLTLGWHWDELHLTASLAGFAPTGHFRFGGENNTGMGFWTFMPYVVASYRTTRGIFEDFPLLAMSALRYEVHSDQEGRDFRPGDSFTYEWGLGVEILERTSVGVLGFVYHQVTDPRGSDATPVDKYRAFGIGGSISQGVGPVDISVRVYQDFEVQNGPEGTAVFLEIGWGWGFPREAETEATSR